MSSESASTVAMRPMPSRAAPDDPTLRAFRDDIARFKARLDAHLARGQSGPAAGAAGEGGGGDSSVLDACDERPQDPTFRAFGDDIATFKARLEAHLTRSQSLPAAGAAGKGGGGDSFVLLRGPAQVQEVAAGAQGDPGVQTGRIAERGSEAIDPLLQDPRTPTPEAGGRGRFLLRDFIVGVCVGCVATAAAASSRNVRGRGVQHE